MQYIEWFVATLTLTTGVPLELVQRVTGHKTTDVVLKHYFRPGQEDFRRESSASVVWTPLAAR